MLTFKILILVRLTIQFHILKTDFLKEKLQICVCCFNLVWFLKSLLSLESLIPRYSSGSWAMSIYTVDDNDDNDQHHHHHDNIYCEGTPLTTGRCQSAPLMVKDFLLEMWTPCSPCSPVQRYNNNNITHIQVDYKPQPMRGIFIL